MDLQGFRLSALRLPHKVISFTLGKIDFARSPVFRGFVSMPRSTIFQETHSISCIPNNVSGFWWCVIHWKVQSSLWERWGTISVAGHRESGCLMCRVAVATAMQALEGSSLLTFQQSYFYPVLVCLLYMHIQEEDTHTHTHSNCWLISSYRGWKKMMKALNWSGFKGK